MRVYKVTDGSSLIAGRMCGTGDLVPWSRPAASEGILPSWGRVCPRSLAGGLGGCRLARLWVGPKSLRGRGGVVGTVLVHQEGLGEGGGEESDGLGLKVLSGLGWSCSGRRGPARCDEGRGEVCVGVRLWTRFGGRMVGLSEGGGWGFGSEPGRTSGGWVSEWEWTLGAI
jgi:hypothetical protein